MVDVLGADHGGYVKRMQAAVKAISGGAAALDVKICQLVKLYRAGEPVKMSKRSGDFVTLRDVVDEVGPDAVRFMMVFRKSDAPLDFDFVKVTEQSKDNPVFYVQYAHARTASIFRQAASLEEGDLGAAFLQDLVNERVDAAYLTPLTDPGEMALLRRFADFPRTVESAARSHEPHRIAFYLYELAGEFHAQWNRGNENPLLRFVNPGQPLLTKARLALVHGTRLILSCGLAILGVQAPDEMR
jgi:arginyl-tRNA synthetase